MKDNRDPTCVGLKLLLIADAVRKTHPEMKLSAIADANGLHCPPWTGDGFMSNNPAEHHSQTPQAHLAVGTSSASPSAPGFSE